MLPELKHTGGAVVLQPLRRCNRNVATAVVALTRAPRCGALFWPLVWWQSALVAVAFTALMLLVMGFVDARAIRAVLRLPPGLPWGFDQITDYGKSGWFLWPLGILFLLLAALPTPLTRMSQAVVAAVMVRVGYLFLAIGMPGLFVAVVKGMIGRARPLVEGGSHPFLFKPFTWHWAFASLPSGHATTAFSVLVSFGSLFPRARALLWAYALAILVSRIMVTAHYPSDVLAGAVVGTIGALFVRRYFALRRLGFTIGPEGKVRSLPGPSRRRLKAVARALLAP
jgi:undecaprenyl-diphosphatase